MLLMGDTIGPNNETSITSIKVLVLTFVIYSSDTTINIDDIFEEEKNDTLEKYETPNATFRCPKVMRSYANIII